MSQQINKILPVVFFLSAIALGWLSWQYYGDISIVQSEIKDFEGKNSSLNSVFENVKKLISFSRENPEAADKINMFLPDASGKPNIVSVLANASFSNGLLLKKINFEEPQDAKNAAGAGNTSAAVKEKYKTQNIKLVFSGTYSSLKNFLAFTEKSLRLMDVASLDFKALNNFEKPVPGAAANYEFSVGLKTYYSQKIESAGAEEKIAEAGVLADLSLITEKQFTDLLSPQNYNIDIVDTGDWGNKNIF